MLHPPAVCCAAIARRRVVRQLRPALPRWRSDPRECDGPCRASAADRLPPKHCAASPQGRQLTAALNWLAVRRRRAACWWHLLPSSITGSMWPSRRTQRRDPGAICCFIVGVVVLDVCASAVPRNELLGSSCAQVRARLAQRTLPCFPCSQVVAIDRAARTITARGPGGEERHE